MDWQAIFHWISVAGMAMALDQGKLITAGSAHYAPYVDWIVTTPLLLLSLSWTAMQFTKKDWTLIGFLMSTQVVVITTGFPQRQTSRGKTGLPEGVE